MGYGEGLLAAGREDERVVALCADLTDSTKTSTFSNEFPERFVEMGIGEQSMASVASGMAAAGKTRRGAEERWSIPPSLTLAGRTSGFC